MIKNIVSIIFVMSIVISIKGQTYYSITTEIQDSSLKKKIQKLTPAVQDMFYSFDPVLVTVSFNDSMVVSEVSNDELSQESLARIESDDFNTCVNVNSNFVLSRINIRDTLYILKERLTTDEWLFTGNTSIINNWEVYEAVLIQNDSRILHNNENRTIVWYHPNENRIIGPGRFVGFPGIVVRVQTKTSVINLENYFDTESVACSCKLEGEILTKEEEILKRNSPFSKWLEKSN